MTRRARALLLGLAALLAAAPAAHAQRRRTPGQPERSPFLDGTHAFRRVLYEKSGKKIESLPPSDFAKGIEPERTLVVVLGDPAPLELLDRVLDGLEGFVSNGGALLVATDHRTPPLFGGRVNGVLVRLPGGGAEAYRGMPECPLIQPQRGASPDLFEPPFNAAGNGATRKVASNLPSYVEFVAGRVPLPSVAVLPPGIDRGLLPGVNLSFANGGRRGSGRVLLMADQDVFINEMMLQRDDGNIDFSYRLADWLLASPDGKGKRDRILYYEDATVQSSFDIPLKSLPPPPLPPPDTLRGILDELLPAMEQEGFFAQLEEENVANKAVEDLASAVPVWEGAGPAGKIWTLGAIAGSVALGLYGFVRLGTFRYRAEAGGPTLTELLRQQPRGGAIMAQRQEALLREGNLWEAAHGLARQLFLDAGLSPGAGRLPPGIQTAGPWWRRWVTALRWRQLWRLARAARPVRVSPRGFARLAGRAAALRAALADGTVRIN